MQPHLEILQRWMQSVITDPRGIKGGLESAESQQQLNVGVHNLETVIARSQQLTSSERLAIYANAYYLRLIECLESDFPIFRQTVGGEAFPQFALAYLQQFPSRSYTLGRLSENFARFLDESKPTAGDDQGSAWNDFLVDLATLEQALNVVFDGPGIEGKEVVTFEGLRNIDEATWPQARLQFVPCFRLVSLRFPVNRYYTAAKQGDASVAPFLDRQECYLAVTRRDFIVRRFDLDQAQFALLSALALGETVGEAILAGAERSPCPAEEFAPRLQQWFCDWAAAPFFARVLVAR
jgi:hypothetical protein